MASELLASLGLFKSMLDTAKGLKGINDAAIRNAAVIELQEKILTAQEQQMALVERVGELEKEVARSKTWGTEKQRYSLTQCAPGAFAYVVKRSEARGEPGHALCAACYERGIKSILQTNGSMMLIKHAWVCPSCRAEVKTHGEHLPEFSD
ncbi:MAG TPA: hypothetical protein VGA60_04220 [Kiloniellales bacterium]|jgi:hypothetical protein